MLYGMVRVTRPATVVEFGFYSGQSAYNFLRAMDPEARIYSFDVDPNCANTARLRFGGEPRLKLILKPMEEFEPEDVDGRTVDFVFIDGSHDFEGTCETFRRLMPVLAPDAIVAVHDTGTLPRRFFPDGHPYLEQRDRWVDDEYEGEPGERAFVNWILDEHPEFAQLHLHSRRVHRAGITVLQRTFRLKRPEGAEG